MFVAAALVAVCVVGNAVSAATVPPPEKIFYDLEDAENLFQEFIVQHKKVYGSTEEHLKRFEIFKESLKRINKWNSEHPDKVFVIHHFDDRTDEEMFGFKPLNTSTTEAVEPHFPNGFIDPPKSFDWRDKGVVSPVKDQGFCGSCFIFSAIGSIEGQYAIKHNECISLSEQQCMDCLDITGCDGGDPCDVMNQLARDKAGSMKEADYPYKAQPQPKCLEEQSKKAATVLGGKVLQIKDEDVLLQALLQYGPLSVGIDGHGIKKYNGKGIFAAEGCNGEAHHAVLLVGYGEEKGVKFWIIKNSWGAGYGQQGYLYLVRGVNGCSMGTSYTAVADVA